MHSPLANDFIAGLEQLHSPELFWKDRCDNELKPLMKAPVAQRDKVAVARVCQQIHAELLNYRSWAEGSESSAALYSTPSLDKGPLQRKFAQVSTSYHYQMMEVTVVCLQDYMKKIEGKFGQDGTDILSKTLNEYTGVVNGLYEEMKQRLKTGPALLKDYSPWLDAFQANKYPETLEIPG